MLLIAYAACSLAGIDLVAIIGGDVLDVIVGLVAVIPMLMLLAWGLRNPQGAVGKVTMQARDFVIQFLRGIGLPGFALISLLAGIGEEALFRGFLQTFIAQHSTAWAGIVLASIIFGLAHAVSRTYAIVATVIGVYLGLLYFYTGNLVAPVVCHAVYDFIALVWLTRSAPDRS